MLEDQPPSYDSTNVDMDRKISGVNERVFTFSNLMVIFQTKESQFKVFQGHEKTF